MMKIITKNEQGEPVEVNALTFDEEYSFATSPFDEEPRLPEMPRDHTVMHQTVGGKGVIGRLRKP
jgi:hypothetical protein